MQLSINGKQMNVGDALRTHIEDRLPDAIEKYFDNTTDSTVTITKEASEFVVDIHVHVSKRIDVHGQGHSVDPYAAYDEAQEHVAKRLRRYKRRLRDHKGRSESEILAAQQYVLQSETIDDEPEHDEPIIIAEMSAEVETMSVGEAVMRMDLSNQPLQLFRSSKHGGINVVYKRADGNISWVDPKQPG